MGSSCSVSDYNLCYIFSRRTWCHIHVFTSHWPRTLLLSLLRKPIMSSWLLLKSPMLVLNQPISWWNVIHVMANTWLAVCCSVVMWYQRMWTQLLQQSRQREPFSLWTGAQLASRLVLTFFFIEYCNDVAVIVWSLVCSEQKCFL